MVLYCKHCFKKIEYKLNKPDECPHCSKSLSSHSSSPSRKSVLLSSRQVGKTALINNRLNKEAEDLDLIDDDQFYDENYQSGKFDHFLASTRENVIRQGVTIEIDKGNSVKMGDILEAAGVSRSDIKEKKPTRKRKVRAKSE